MRILGCFKAVPALDLLREEDWVADDSLRVDTEYVKLEWNCFDEGALEMMRKLSDLSEGLNVVFERDALTVGGKKADSFLKILYALGFSHAVRVESEEGAYTPPELLAELIAAYIQKKAEAYDVVVTGVQSADASHGKTPYLLAEMLQWPCISQVTGMEPAKGGCLKVTSQTGRGEKVQIVRPPCVLAVGNAPCAYLRVPTLKDKMRLGNRPIEYVDPGVLLSDAGAFADRIETLLALCPVDRSRDTVRIESGSPEEKAKVYYEQYLKGRLLKL